MILGAIRAMKLGAYSSSNYLRILNILASIWRGVFFKSGSFRNISFNSPMFGMNLLLLQELEHKYICMFLLVRASFYTKCDTYESLDRVFLYTLPFLYEKLLTHKTYDNIQAHELTHANGVSYTLETNFAFSPASDL